MAPLNCFCSSSWKKKKDKGEKNPIITRADNYESNKSSEISELKSSFLSAAVPFLLSGTSKSNAKVMNHESPVSASSREADYEGGDEQDKILAIKTNYNFHFHLRDDSEEEKYQTLEKNPNVDRDDEINGFETVETGHESDPGVEKVKFWISPKLKRSCSDLAMRTISQELAPLKTKSYEEMEKLSEMYKNDPKSPGSVKSHCSADKVMLKKHSSMQILPSGSRRLWWKLFLWSHRNMHRVVGPTAKPEIKTSFALVNNQQGGYSSDNVTPRRAVSGREKRLDGFDGVSGMWPQNQWVAFPENSSPFSRVDEWVKEVSSVQEPTTTNTPFSVHAKEEDDENGGALRSSSSRLGRQPEEITHANNVVGSLNSSSTVAHIASIGLKVIPIISHFSSLRSVNLSGNFIAHITPGSLPKGLHSLNLSRNKINTIEGLRELTRLRVLDLSYNRISRIGQGLSNCTLIKELYIAGNKISNVEGLHRLLKLNVLDLSFNKITTTKALGQLVANYNSLIALNLLGNPIHSNMSEEQLRKTVCSLLTKLALLNKQPINQKKAREIRTDSIAKAALGNSSSWNSRRKGFKRQGSSTSLSFRRINNNNKSRHSSLSRSHRVLELKDEA